jgi:hypothetical protein
MRYLALLLLAPLAACTIAHPIPPISPIAGVWKTACLPIGKNGRHGFVTTLTATRKELTAVSQVYAHSNCDTPTVRTTFRATLATITETSGAIDLDHVVGGIERSLDAADVVDAYNKPGSGCGFGGGWRRGVSRDVTGQTCAPFTFPVTGTRLYERVWIEGDTLRLGSFPVVWTNTSPERRPAHPGGLTFARVPG